MPTNSLCDMLLNYRTYRLKLPTRKRTSKQTGNNKDQIMTLELTLHDHK